MPPAMPPARAEPGRDRLALVSWLPAEVLARVGAFVDDEASALCARLSCRALRDALRAPARTPRAAMLRTAALAACAWELPGFRSAAFDEHEQAGLCAHAAREGSVAALEWLRAKGCAWDGGTCSAAAGAGHLEVLQWARKHGCPWDHSTCTAAAGGGHLEVLQWAWGHGCGWNWTTCTAAARNGHLPALRWAREHGCAWHWETCDAAARNGQLSALQWAHERGCPLPPWPHNSRCLRAVQGAGHVHVLLWFASLRDD